MYGFQKIGSDGITICSLHIKKKIDEDKVIKINRYIQTTIIYIDYVLPVLI